MDTNRNILNKLLLFVLLVVVINSLLTILYYQVYAIKKPYFKTEKKYQKQKSKVTTLVLGHSRAVFGIDVQQIDGAFNYATYGENNIYTYYKFKKLLKDPSNKIKRIIIPVGRSTFFSNSRPDMADHSYWSKYLDYIELGKVYDNQAAYFSIYLQAKTIPYAHFIKSELNKKSKKKKQNFKELKTSQEKLFYAKKSINHNFSERNYYDDVSYLYLNKLLELCKENEVEVVAIKFPVTRYYYEVFNQKMIQYKFNEVKFLNLFKTYKIDIWNEEQYFKNDDTMFKDVHHLNKRGRENFTKYLKTKF